MQLTLSSQSAISSQRAMPVDDVANSCVSTSVSGETVQLYYYHSTTNILTVDAGEGAGTVVVGKLNYNNILNKLGDAIAVKGDTSLSFTSSALTTEVAMPGAFDAWDQIAGASRARAITANFSNGQFCVDFRRGVIYGKKASTATTLTSTAYKYPSKAGGSVSLEDVSTETTLAAILASLSNGSVKTLPYPRIPESGTDATGADTYATILTPSTTFTRIMIVNEGVNPAIVSIDGGSTETFKRIPGESVLAYDGVSITATAIQAKNASAGNNYANLTITVW